MKHIRMLVISKHAAKVRQLEAALEGLGDSRPQYTRATTLPQALRRISVEPFDVALYDLAITGDDGASGLARLRAAAPGLPTIVLTDDEHDPAALMALRNGALDHLAGRHFSAERLARILRIVQEQRQAQRRLEREEARFQQIFEDASVGMAMANSEGRFVQVNRAFCQILGYTPTELQRMHHWEVTYPEDAAGYETLLQSAIANGERSVQLETRYRRKNGGTMWALLTISIFRDADGKPQWFIGQAQDITARKQAEIELRQSEEQFRTLFASMLEGFAYCRMYFDTAGRAIDWTYLEVNPAFERITGLKNAVGRRVTELIPELPASNPDLFEIYGRVVRSGNSEEFEVEVKPLKAWFHVSAIRPAPDHFVAVFEDITQRKRAEQALRESEERFRIIAENSPVLLWMTDANGRTQYVNRTYREFFGATGEQPSIHPADRPGYLAVFAQAIRARRSFRAEVRMQRTDGEWRWLAANAEPRFGQSGEFLGHIGISSDVTERQQGEHVRAVLLSALEATSTSDRLEEFLEKIRQSLGTLMDTTNFFVALYDPQKQSYSFPCFADPFDPPPPAGTPLPGSLTDYVRRTGRPLLLDADGYRQLVETGEVKIVGTPMISWLGVPLKTAERIIGVMVVQSYNAGTLFTLNDRELLQLVSGHIAVAIERKRALDALIQSEAQLRQSQKMEAVGRLAGGVAHDFNNLLTTILGYSELALLTLPQGSPLTDGVTQIRKSAERAAALTRQLLAFSRKQVLQPKVLRLNDVVTDMEKMLRRLIGEDVQLVTQLDRELGSVKADPGQLEQVIMNLVVNARDAMQSGGEVAIETANINVTGPMPGITPDVSPGHYVLLSVHDSGCGMDENTLAHIFEPFFTTKEPGKGTGLGLPTVYGISEQSGGFVRVKSRPAAGTTFFVYLPRTDAVAGDLETPVAETSTARGQETILLVEDESGVRQLTRDLLKGRGYTVLDAACGRDALEIAGQISGPIELMVTDLVMPGLTGRELAVEMSRRRPHMKVLFISGYPSEQCLGDLSQAEIAFLPKPFTANDLYVTVRCVLDDRLPLKNGMRLSAGEDISHSG
jgi:two-component system, cell cycle sensor histidine kinase and response regulator CckA